MEGKGKGEEKGRDPQGLVDTPMFQILKNTLKGTQFLHLQLLRSSVPTPHISYKCSGTHNYLLVEI